MGNTCFMNVVFHILLDSLGTWFESVNHHHDNTGNSMSLHPYVRSFSRLCLQQLSIHVIKIFLLCSLNYEYSMLLFCAFMLADRYCYVLYFFIRWDVFDIYNLYQQILQY